MMEELPIQINGSLGKLRGIVHKGKSPCQGVVILIHGYFSSNKLGPVNLYVQIARLFANKGYDFWRIDSFGVGDSDGNFIQSTYELRLKDYIIITELAIQEHSNLIFLGHSMGTSIAIHLANYFHNFVTKLFLLSPSFGKFTWYENLFNNDLQIQLSTLGIVERKGLTITKEFIEKMTTEEIYQNITNCDIGIILYYGLNDEYYDMLAIKHAIQYMRSYELIEIPDADHNFLTNRNLLLENIVSRL
jgi:uncharacterized protein